MWRRVTVCLGFSDRNPEQPLQLYNGKMISGYEGFSDRNPEQPLQPKDENTNISGVRFSDRNPEQPLQHKYTRLPLFCSY